MRGFAFVRVCACASARVISEFSILLWLFTKLTKHTLLMYPTFHVNFFHVGLFVLLFMCR